MRFETSQHMRLGQQMKLAPRMIQSMEILQMPMAALEERIEQELESNPALELVEARPPEPAPGEEGAPPAAEGPMEVTPAARDDFERLGAFEEDTPDAAENEYSSGAERFERDYEPSFARGSGDGERDGKLDAMAAIPSRPRSLVEQLLDQWRLGEAPEELRAPGELIIQFLDEDGFLRTPLETIADRAPAADAQGRALERPSGAALERALKAVQATLEPVGIAARDLRECLLLQLDALERESPPPRGSPRAEALEIARWIVEDHLESVLKNRLPRIAAETGLTLEEIKAGIDELRRLSTAPARALVQTSAEPIIPDAIVEYDEATDRYIAYLNETRLPNLQVNREVARLARDKTAPAQDREFVRKNLSNAQWLMDAIRQRKQTLLRVVNAVVEAQRDYFDLGPQALKPLPMTQVADQLGIHVATVSRAVADKHLQTPRGIVPLRGFFTGGLATEGGGEMSYDAVKAALREVVEAEDKSKPLSDDAIADALRARGIEIARRTVAKYREQLAIPAARMRKAF